LVIDMDGVLWRGGTPLPGLAAFFDALAARAMPRVLATNNAGRTPAQYVARLAAWGVPIAPDDVLTAALVAAGYMANTLDAGAPVYVIGQEGLREALAGAGFRLVDDIATPAVAVAVGFDRHLTYDKLKLAALHLQRGARFIGTNGDVTYPAEEGLLPGNGATLAALTAATGRAPEIVGKPERPMFDAALRRLGLPAADVAMIGDRLDTDIVGAERAGLRTILVETGVDDAAAAARAGVRPDLVVAGIDVLARAWGGGG